MTRAALVLAIAAAALAAGCGENIDEKDLETQLRTKLAPQGGAKPEDITVDCPGGQEVEKGRKFNCTLTAPDGTTARIDVTLTDDEGGFDAYVPPEQFKER